MSSMCGRILRAPVVVTAVVVLLGWRLAADEREDPEREGAAIGRFSEPILPELKRGSPLHERWRVALSGGSLLPADAARLLADAARSEEFLRREPSLYVSPWSAYVDLLRGRPYPGVEPPRAAEPLPDSPRTVRASAPGGAKLIARFRMYPWAPAVHEALLGYGGESLRLGYAGIARRAFEDVLENSASPDTRAAARAGLWLSLGQLWKESSTEALDEAFRGVDPAEMYPWFGKPTAAGTIRAMLLESLRAARGAGREDGAADDGTVVTLASPPRAAWTFPRRTSRDSLRSLGPRGHLQWIESGDDGGFLLSGPRLLAGYAADGRLLWSRGRETLEDRAGEREERRRFRLPGAFVPAVSANRVISRWSAPSEFGFTDVFAFDAASGLAVWSASSHPGWSRLAAVSDPVVAEGNVYLLGTDRVNFQTAPLASVFLVCLAEGDGRLRWRRRLATGACAVEVQERGPSPEIDVVQFGDAVTVSGGAVYCSTGMGVVARCDARDGLPEWVRTYRRARRARRLSELLRDGGTSPVVRSGAAVFFPRDAPGAFAVDSENGTLLWENEVLEPRRVLGCAGDVVALAEPGRLSALRIASGAVAWRLPLSSPLAEGRAILSGKFLYLARQEGAACRIARIDAKTGELVDDMAAPISAPLALALGSDRLALLSPRGAAGGGDRRERRAAPELPLIRERYIRRPAARLMVPPPETGLTDRAYVVSGGLLECVVGTESSWHRLLPSPLLDQLWPDSGTMLLVFSWGLSALDSSSGRSRWIRPLPFSPRDLESTDGRLFVGHLRERHAAVVDLASGHLRWIRRLPRDGRARYDAVRLEGDEVRLLGRSRRQGASEPLLLTLDARDGATVRTASRPGFTRRRQRAAPSEMEFEAGERRVGIWRPDGGERRFYELPPRREWGQVSELLDARVRGERLWVFSVPTLDDGERRARRLRIDLFDLESHRRVATQLLPEVSPRPPERREEEEGEGERSEGSGRRDVPVAFVADTLLVADRNGLHAFVAARHRETPRDIVVHRSERLIVIDGNLDDWEEEAAVIPGSLLADEAELRAVHAGGSVYLGLRFRDRDLGCPMGGGKAVDGDRLEIGLTTGRGSYRFTVGPSPGAHTAVAPSGSDSSARGEDGESNEEPPVSPLPPGMRSGFSFDARRQEGRLEIAIPIGEPPGREGGAETVGRAGLSAVLFDDGPRGARPRRRAAWGGALAGPLLQPEAHAQLHFHPLTLREHEAALARVHAASELEESFQYYRRECRVRTTSPERCLELHADFIRRHPGSTTAGRLAAIDLEIRRRFGEDLHRAIVETALAAGAPKRAVEGFRRYATSYLSQWIYLAGHRGRPRSIAVGLEDAGGVQRFAYAVKLPFDFPHPAERVTTSPPVGRWYEMRVPLLLLGMHDRPIHGLWFLQQGEPLVIWDRTSIVVEGRDNVLIDDSAPAGELVGDWRWEASRVESGRRAHSSRVPAQRYDVVRHGVRLGSPEMRHLAVSRE